MQNEIEITQSTAEITEKSASPSQIIQQIGIFHTNEQPLQTTDNDLLLDLPPSDSPPALLADVIKCIVIEEDFFRRNDDCYETAFDLINAAITKNIPVIIYCLNENSETDMFQWTWANNLNAYDLGSIAETERASRKVYFDIRSAKPLIIHGDTDKNENITIEESKLESRLKSLGQDEEIKSGGSESSTDSPDNLSAVINSIEENKLELYFEFLGQDGKIKSGSSELPTDFPHNSSDIIVSKDKFLPSILNLILTKHALDLKVHCAYQSPSVKLILSKEKITQTDCLFLSKGNSTLYLNTKKTIPYVIIHSAEDFNQFYSPSYVLLESAAIPHETNLFMDNLNFQLIDVIMQAKKEEDQSINTIRIDLEKDKKGLSESCLKLQDPLKTTNEKLKKCIIEPSFFKEGVFNNTFDFTPENKAITQFEQLLNKELDDKLLELANLEESAKKTHKGHIQIANTLAHEDNLSKLSVNDKGCLSIEVNKSFVEGIEKTAFHHFISFLQKIGYDNVFDFTVFGVDNEKNLMATFNDIHELIHNFIEPFGFKAHQEYKLHIAYVTNNIDLTDEEIMEWLAKQKTATPAVIQYQDEEEDLLFYYYDLSDDKKEYELIKLQNKNDNLSKLNLLENNIGHLYVSREKNSLIYNEIVSAKKTRYVDIKKLYWELCVKAGLKFNDVWRLAQYYDEICRLSELLYQKLKIEDVNPVEKQKLMPKISLEENGCLSIKMSKQLQLLNTIKKTSYQKGDFDFDFDSEGSLIATFKTRDELLGFLKPYGISFSQEAERGYDINLKFMLGERGKAETKILEQNLIPPTLIQWCNNDDKAILFYSYHLSVDGKPELKKLPNKNSQLTELYLRDRGLKEIHISNHSSSKDSIIWQEIASVQNIFYIAVEKLYHQCSEKFGFDYNDILLKAFYPDLYKFSQILQIQLEGGLKLKSLDCTIELPMLSLDAQGHLHIVLPESLATQAKNAYKFHKNEVIKESFAKYFLPKSSILGGLFQSKEKETTLQAVFENIHDFKDTMLKCFDIDLDDKTIENLYKNICQKDKLENFESVWEKASYSGFSLSRTFSFK